MIHLFADSEFKLLNLLKRERIAQEYERQLGIDVSRLVGSDIEYREDLASGVRYFFPFSPGDDSFYNSLQNFEWYYQETKSEYEFASRFTQDRTVLDIGCGTGKFAHLARARPYKGLEPNRAAAEGGRRKGLDIINMQLIDYRKTSSAVFEVVTLFQVIEHVPEPIKFLKTAIDFLRPGGLLIVSVPAEDGFVGKAKNNILNLPPHHLSRWTDAALIKVGGVLSLELIDLHHEPLDAVHVDWYASVKMREKLEGLLMLKSSKLLDDSAGEYVIRVSSHFLAKLTSLAVAARRRKLHGHTVTAIYRKNV